MQARLPQTYCTITPATSRGVMVFVLLWGAWLRLLNLTQLGLEHDEVANWLIDRSIIDGNHGIYFSAAYGHEAGFHYLQTLFVTLIGDNALALRLPATALGILLIALSFTLVRTLYSRPMALVTASILAATFFPTFYSRLALRAMMLPVFSGLAAYFFWRGELMQTANERGNNTTSFSTSYSSFVLAALFAGLSTYTYMASRVVPIFFAGWLCLSFVVYISQIWQSRSTATTQSENTILGNKQISSPINNGILIFWGIYCIVAAPLFIYLAMNPSAEFRVSEINAPLEAARNGDLSLIWQNAKLIFGVWGWSGDPLWRQNVAGMPIFNPLTATLFYGGAALALWQRKRADLFCLLWIATSTIPSLVTNDAPSTIRMINMLPLLGVFPAKVIHTLSTLSTKKAGLSTTFWQISWISCLIIGALWATLRNFHATQTVWPVSDEVPFVWQTALTSAGRWLDTQNPIPTTVIGWTPDTMDEPTLALTMRSNDVPLRFSSKDAVVLPMGEQMRLIRPKTPDLALPSSLEAQLIAWDTTISEFEHFAAYTIRWTPDHFIDPLNVRFGDELTLLGHGNCPQQNDWCETATVWQINTTISDPRSVFIHLTDATGNLVSQSDVQLAGGHSWRAGDLLFVSHQLSVPEGGTARVGAYHSQTWQRLLLEDGGDLAEIDLIR